VGVVATVVGTDVSFLQETNKQINTINIFILNIIVFFIKGKYSFTIKQII
jgi:hypothetical protein